MPWINQLTQAQGPNILRCKGIVALKDDPKRFVFQGVHMMLDGEPQRDWKPGEKRESKVVFIGRDLDEERDPQGLPGLRGLKGDDGARFMTDEQTSLTAARARLFEAGAHVVGGAPSSATSRRLALGRRRDTARRAEAARRIAAHPERRDPRRGVATAKRLVTGGDDGRVVATAADGAIERSPMRRAAGSTRSRPAADAIAWSAGKQARARDAARRGEEPGPRRPRCAASVFLPKGYRLALAHYNGVSLWFPNVGGRADPARMEGLASRRDCLARRALSRHLDAGECAARLAALRLPQHAHDRLSQQDALALLVA